MKDVFVVAAKRTPIGGLMGALSGYTAPQLGAMAIKAALAQAFLAPEQLSSVYMGNVLSAGLGQAPARQAAIYAGIPYDKDATTINKVCSSGMKATMIGAQQIALGMDDLVISGGMESMSNVPHYAYLRNGTKVGDVSLKDGMTQDGLWDAYDDIHMGSAAELVIKTFGHTREELDNYALRSYTRAQQATAGGKFEQEVVPVSMARSRASDTMKEDEDIYKLVPEKLPLLRPAFETDGLLTAANSSNLNDGAAALLLASERAVKMHHLRPVARIAGYADAAQAPGLFTTAPALAIEKVLKQTGLRLSQIDFWEINEAYASVVLSNQRILGFDLEKTNVYGGAVALGHPIGASGARILVTLLHVLQQEHGKYGIASICNGGGGASAILVENLL